ncbi:hypothetical protein IW262DRAFT_1381457 [Armillaria fumosa]|nr:hypothetical protein IW262DRAFT_1381457 [Armillaria fumosa]
MCHRQLLFQQSQQCTHLTKTGEIAVDCRYPKCFNSSIHPPRCGTSKAPCSCRRYFDNPVRKITAVVSCILLPPPSLAYFTGRSPGNVTRVGVASNSFGDTKIITLR